MSNEGKKWVAQAPFQVNANTFVFGGFDGGWFKMVSVTADGTVVECRHTKDAASIGGMTVAIWEAAIKNGDRSYSVEDIDMTQSEGKAQEGGGPGMFPPLPVLTPSSPCLAQTLSSPVSSACSSSTLPFLPYS